MGNAFFVFDDEQDLQSNKGDIMHFIRVKSKGFFKHSKVHLIFLLFLFTLSCNSLTSLGTENISDINTTPGKYDDKTINVKGRVTESFIIFGTGYFIISDDTGSIPVIPSKTFPNVGEQIKIKGKVKTAFVIGDKSLIVIVEEQKGE